MARYYEADTLIEFVKQNTPHFDGETTMQCVERAISEAPAADVVPKSEVAREIREIFEEIERITAAAYNNFMFDRESVGMNTTLVVEFSDEIDREIAELKKKYTEGL